MAISEQPQEKKRDFTTTRLLGLIKNNRTTIIYLIFLIIAAAAADISVPFISQRLIDSLINFLTNGGQAPVKFLILAITFILILSLFYKVAKSIYNFHLFKFVTTTEDEMRHQAFEKYITLHALYHHGVSSGQIIGRIERGATAAYVILHDIFGQNMLPPLISFIGVLVALSFKNPLIAIIVFLPLPIYILTTYRLTNRIYEIEKQVNEEFEELHKEAYDVAGNVLTVKKFSQEKEEIRLQKKLLGKARDTQYSAEKLWALIESIQTLISTVGSIAVILTAGWLVFKGGATIGEFVLYISLQNMAYSPLTQLSIVLPRLKRSTARLQRLFDIIDEPQHVVDKPSAKIMAPVKKGIEFNNVSFRFNPARWSLKDINVKIAANSRVALVGRSGAGKTTFINLLLRSYDPQIGSIIIDNVDIRDVTQESLRAQIAVVPQEIELFSRTVAENIAYGRRQASRDEIVEAARLALAHEFIIKLEKSYDTIIGERGIKLSGGERQRIGIARAILKNPSLLILDEATSHLDTESERLIQQATETLIKNRTTIIIAHRLSTVLTADSIFVFNNGQLEIAGSHEQIIKTNSTYQRLYSLQFTQ